jgi:hypothetical protein
MRRPLLLAVLILSTTSYPLAAPEQPYLTNVSFAGGSTRGTLVNTTAVALTAWYVDVIDAGGRPLVSESSDAIELPGEFVPPRGTRVIEISSAPEGAVAVVFRAAVDANGNGIGDGEIVGRLKEAREWRKKQKSERVPVSR